jgi:hypothetical protein
METVRVEGFGNILRGEKIWSIGSEALVSNRLHVLDQELLGRGRRVLILADGRKHTPRWATKHEWDAIFHIKDGVDLRLAITYVANGVKPMRVVWCGDEPSPAILKAMVVPEVTFLGYGSEKPKGDWSAIFFSGEMEANRIEESLISRMGSGRLSRLNLKSVIPELRAVKAGLVWSSIGEPEKAGAVYWYDISEGEPPHEPFDATEAADFLREIADRIASAK